MALQSRLRQIVVERDVQFIGDEDPHPTCAKRVADDLNIRHAFIDIPLDDEAFSSIREEQKNHPAAARLPSDDRRDDFMVKRTIAEAGDATSVLVMCGWAHLEPLAARFLKTCHDVRKFDSACDPAIGLTPDRLPNYEIGPQTCREESSHRILEEAAGN
jgi:hypothetical protein